MGLGIELGIVFGIALGLLEQFPSLAVSSSVTGKKVLSKIAASTLSVNNWASLPLSDSEILRRTKAHFNRTEGLIGSNTQHSSFGGNSVAVQPTITRLPLTVVVSSVNNLRRPAGVLDELELGAVLGYTLAVGFSLGAPTKLPEGL